jgi:PQQ-dependent dehydrogenase (methanol/ethanol family)
MMSKRTAFMAGGAAALCLAITTNLPALAGTKAQAPSADASGWGSYGRTPENTRFSPLKQITSANVTKLKLAYTLQFGSLRSNESTPLVIGDTMYVSTSWGPKYVYALDAATGARKWVYEPDIPDDVLQYACCDVNSRGVTYADGKIFVGRLDGNLSAVDAATGKELWTTQVVDYKQGSVITSPPIVVRNVVITGFGGGEYGARGSLQAYDVNTGKQVWKTWTVPGPGEVGNDSWKGDSWKHGGAVPWLVGSYDAKTDTVYYGTSNPSPWNSAVRSTGNGNYGKLNNLYSASTLAIDPTTGKIKWHFQGTPEDAWDYDGVNELVLADLKIKGETVPALMKADRNGFFYVLNRESGKLLSAEKFVPTTWAEKIDIATGLPVEDPAMRPGPNHPVKGVCPNLIGGKNWQPMSYNPMTGYVYIPSNNICMDWGVSDVSYKRGVFYLGAEFPTHPGPGGYMGEIEAWDPVAQKKVWGVKEDLPFNGGTLSTAGNLVFYGNMHGVFKALDAKSGKVLWSSSLGTGIGAGPVSFAVNGKQYIGIVVGRTAAIPAFLGDVGKLMTAATPEGGALFVFTE